VFTVEERDRVRERLLALGEKDPDIAAAAITGSHASGRGDEWSDIDLAFAVTGDLASALARWTEILERDFAALHHWDLPFGSIVYRVFLLPGGLEVDVAFAPVADFGASGPDWRTVFGESVDRGPTPPPGRDDLVGIAWHHVLHARACLERGKPWQAEWLISGVRDQVIALACVRLGLPARFAKGADLLPSEVTAPLEAALVGSLDDAELWRALAAAVDGLLAELERTEPALATRLGPTLAEFAGPR
jgi:hypothetical protein